VGREEFNHGGHGEHGGILGEGENVSGLPQCLGGNVDFSRREFKGKTRNSG
jgi:hypothetical protein